LVNPVVYEALQQAGDLELQRFGLAPDPVPSTAGFDKPTARKMLGIPVDGRYVGFVGQMDRRKAIRELVSAWTAGMGPHDYLLLAGRLDPEYRRFIDSHCQQLMEKGRVIVMDRQLSEAELLAGYCALDLIAILQYRRPNLSANLLKAVAAKRPVLVDDYGYTGLITKRFQVGHVCDVMNHDQLVGTMFQALEETARYTNGPSAKRLIQYHEPSNFVNTCLHGMNGLMQNENSRPIKTWQWACQGIEPPAA
jgi:glycosyltransferase involved in cell wall biosynthesis